MSDAEDKALPSSTKPEPAEEEVFDFDDEDEPEPTPEEVAAAVKDLKARCAAASIEIEEVPGIDPEDVFYRVLMPSGREKRPISLFDHDDVVRLLKVQFEDYVVLSGYEAICSYKDGLIEAALRTIGTPGLSLLERRLRNEDGDVQDLVLSSPTSDLPQIRFGKISPELEALGRHTSSSSLRISNTGITQHDRAVEILERLSNSIFFQLDRLFGIGVGLRRYVTRLPARRHPGRNRDIASQVQYPTAEYDAAPLSLYWYARGASGMPLLQFLAYYQVLEFYFPTYSQADARRRIQFVLKDPAFRSDRDADVARLLTAIQGSRGGGFGDERSQLRATIAECTDAQSVREFVTQDETRRTFFASKAKGLTDNKLPIGNESADLRTDVADRIYDIRCKIVHTKADSGDGSFELLLPFSREAELLTFDIELIHFLAQRVLIAASSPL
jgi:hypothetical protein